MLTNDVCVRVVAGTFGSQSVQSMRSETDRKTSRKIHPTRIRDICPTSGCCRSGVPVGDGPGTAHRRGSGASKASVWNRCGADPAFEKHRRRRRRRRRRVGSAMASGLPATVAFAEDDNQVAHFDDLPTSLQTIRHSVRCVCVCFCMCAFVVCAGVCGECGCMCSGQRRCVAPAASNVKTRRMGCEGVSGRPRVQCRRYAQGTHVRMWMCVGRHAQCAAAGPSVF